MNNIKKIIITLIGISLSIFVFVLLFMYQAEDTEAYKTALIYVESSNKIKEITGGVEGIGMLGRSLTIENPANNKNGSATFNLPVKGKQKDISIIIHLLQDSLSNWHVREVIF